MRGRLAGVSDAAKTPLTVLGGWLGAGKTTMVNRILASTTERIAVIVNDVGEVNVDAELIRTNVDDDGLIELTNGCVCCAIGDDLYATLHELTARTPAPERILLEASGVADPRQIVGFLDHPKVTLDAVIALAEGANFEYRSSGPPFGSLMRAQLAGADLVVATKLDLVPEHGRQASIDELRQFTKARILEANTDPEWLSTVILGVHENPDHALPDGSSAPVATTTWRSSGPVDAAVLKARLARSGLVRAKGSVDTADGPVIVHLAGGRVNLTPLLDAEPLGAIVLIGESADEVAAIAQRLDD